MIVLFLYAWCERVAFANRILQSECPWFADSRHILNTQCHNFGTHMPGIYTLTPEELFRGFHSQPIHLAIHPSHRAKLRAFVPSKNTSQVALANYWTEIGGYTFLPGTHRAADRFARLSYNLHAVPKVNQSRQAGCWMWAERVLESCADGSWRFLH